MGGFTLPFERLFFADGQLLASRDFRAGERAGCRYRELHNKHVHDVWGIALGLDVELLKNKTGVSLHPGYAIDTSGRDILIPQKLTLHVPHTATTELLVLAVGVCPGSIGWSRAANFRSTDLVPLATAHVANGKIKGVIGLDVRHYADPLARPPIGSGSTEKHQTGWKDSLAPNLWIETLVDTSSAGFTKAPEYFAFATLECPGFVEQVNAGSFLYRVLKGATPFGIKVTPADLEKAGTVVSWIGVEKNL